jgi:hypothetical protein
MLRIVTSTFSAIPLIGPPRSIIGGDAPHVTFVVAAGRGGRQEGAFTPASPVTPAFS